MQEVRNPPENGSYYEIRVKIRSILAVKKLKLHKLRVILEDNQLSKLVGQLLFY